MIHASRSQKQATATPGCFGVVTRKTRGLAFWTLTTWEGEKSLREYLGASPHREAIPKLFPWCDEAATTHWHTDSKDMPGWEEATAQLVKSGRLLRVKFPSREQSERRINVD